MKLLYATTFLFLFAGLSYGQSYKEMMDDPSVNFYDVVKAAELHFASHPKGKGSGYKGYQRWKAEFEGKYFPTGDRSNVDPFFVYNAYQDFLRNNPQQRSSFNNGWRDLGPYDANNITSHYSAGIGRVESFYVDPLDDNHIYLGSRSGGFWYTSDGGATWQNATDTMVTTGVNTIHASPTNADSILINLRNPMVGTSYGIYRSTDGGATFAVTPFNYTNLGWGGPGTNDKVYKVRYHPTVPDLIFVGTSRGVFRSDDNLQTWTQNISSADITDIDFHPTNPNVIYLYDNDGSSSTQNEVLISTDMGLTWNISGTLFGNNNSELHVSVSPDCPNCIFAASNNGVWKSTDQGNNFVFMMNPSNSCDGFAVSDVDTSYMVYGYLDLEMSSDGGQTFTQRTWWANGAPDSTYVHADLRMAECLNGVFWVATDGYLARSPDNGLSWQRLNDGTGIREFYRAGLSQSNWEVAVAGSQDNGSSVLVESGWLEWNGGDGMEGVVQPLNDNWIIGSWQYGTRFRSTDKAQSWNGVGTPEQGDWIAPMFLDPNQQMRVFHCSDTLYKSEAFGSGWEFVSYPGFGNIKHAAIAENNSNIILVSRNNNLLKSMDGGVTWASINSGLPSISISDIAFAPTDDNIIIVTYERYQNDGNKVFISYNQGASWTNITGNLGNMPIRSVAIDHTPDQNIYLGAEIGVYTRPMAGSTWTLYNPGLPNVSVRELEIQYATNVIRAITWGRGMWEYTLVGRNDYPNIWTTTITDPPTDVLPNEVDPQFVTSVISQDNVITSAYVKWSFDNPTLDSTIVMTNTVDSTWVSQTAIPGAPEGTDVYFKVYAVGSAGDTTETYKFHYQTKPNCVSNGNMSWATAVTLVDFNTIYNSTGKTQPYTDYRDSDSTEVTIGNSYDLNLNLNTDGNYTCYGMVWVDWNDDSDFDDTGEEYSLGSATNTPDGPTTLSPLSITVPGNAVPGPVTMRVSSRFGAPATPCETDYDGEVEDYLLIVKQGCSTTGSNISTTVCNSYSSPAGNTYTSTGIYNDTLQNAGGCDSVITIDLTVNYDDASTLFENTCDVYVLNGQTYSFTGTYAQILNTVAGCDSIITLNLTVDMADTAVSVNGATLTAQALGATYQWIDCNNNFAAIPGETNQFFIATSDGSYAVIVDDGVCVDTSSCFTLTGVGIASATFGSTVQVYPNPTTGQLTVDLGQSYQQVKLEVRDVLGKLILSREATQQQQVFLSIDAAPAVYFLTLWADDQQATIHVIKE